MDDEVLHQRLLMQLSKWADNSSKEITSSLVKCINEVSLEKDSDKLNEIL